MNGEIILEGDAARACYDTLAEKIEQIAADLRGFAAGLRQDTCELRLNPTSAAAMLTILIELGREGVIVPKDMIVSLHQFKKALDATTPTCSCAKCVDERQARSGHLC